jgi:hypothetical protein
MSQDKKYLRITHKAVHELLTQNHSYNSLEQVVEDIDENGETLKYAKLFAKQVEDYEFLSVFQEKRELYNKQFHLYWGNEKSGLPL